MKVTILNVFRSLRSRLSIFMNSLNRVEKRMVGVKPKVIQPKKEKKERPALKVQKSTTRAKGKINSDRRTFNHPRKDVPQGRGSRELH